MHAIYVWFVLKQSMHSQLSRGLSVFIHINPKCTSENALPDVWLCSRWRFFSREECLCNVESSGSRVAEAMRALWVCSKYAAGRSFSSP